MKKYLLILCAIPCFIQGLGQNVELWSGVPVIIDAYGHSISHDGTYSTGEAVSADAAWGRDNKTGEIFIFRDASCGNGNNISKSHVSVGTYKTSMTGAFFVPGNTNPVLIPSLTKYTESYVNGINWDGTRIVGFLANPKQGNVDETDPEFQKMSYLPFYCDVEPETLTVSDPVFLPVPKRDFFNLVPQYCTAFWINDDGDTILGQVIDNSGSYIYPIVYHQASNGEWSYSLPSEKLFNPNGLEIPKWPVPEMQPPQAEDFIGNPELKALFEELRDAYITGESTVNPYLMLDPKENGESSLMNEEEWTEYQEALIIYNNYYNSEYEEQLNKYYDEYSRFIAQSTRFLQSSMTMNRAGTLIGQTKIVTRFSGIDPITYENPVVFDLINDTYQIYGNELEELEISQILPDGTLIGVSPKPNYTSPDLTPQHSYVCAPGMKDFVTIENYIQKSNPDYYNWYDEYLHHEVPIGYDELGAIAKKDMVVTGLVAVSDDFTTLSGGVDGWSWDYEAGKYFTYIFNDVTPPDTGIKNVISKDDALLTVYNLQGTKILETKNIDSINSLPKGIYVVNGKKILIK